MVPEPFGRREDVDAAQGYTKLPGGFGEGELLGHETLHVEVAGAAVPPTLIDPFYSGWANTPIDKAAGSFFGALQLPQTRRDP